ncbi:VanW family protein [Solibacillus sp. CAU 1738]|uniref:VanW family protein n=1 Tax=Solibacillus sp. CAU 1738 TaxID=3140363 RepID=UPI003260043F
MIKNVLILLIIMCTVVLTGCFGNLEKENLSNKVIELEQKVLELQRQVTNNENVVVAESDIEETEVEQHVAIKLVDPKTFTVIKTIVPKELGYETDFSAYVNEIEQIAKDLARGSETVAGYDKKMMLDKIGDNGEIIKGSPMVILKESELVERILAASDSGATVELPLYTTESNYNAADIESLDDVVVASYTTYFSPADAGRNKNIELSANAINNVIVGSGDVFSFNTIVGPRNEANGYQPAPEIINAKLVMGIGGGICQTSSTLFNAVDQVLIASVERHHHSLDVGYVPKGRDATVSYGILDYRFQNISGVPFIIKSSYGNGILTVEVRTSPDYVEMLKKTV